MDSPIAHTFGAMFIGAMITMMIYGITLLQTYFYFSFYPKDSIHLKLLVSTLCSLDTIHVILMGHAMYHYLIASFGKPLQLENGTSTLYISVAVNVLMAFIVQWFFTKRIFQLSNSRFTYYLAMVTAFFVFAHFCFGLETVILSWIRLRFDRLSENNFIAALPFAITAILSDILIAASLCVLLSRTTSEFDDTRNILNKLIIWAINRCILTSVVAIIEAVVFIAIPHSLYYFAFDFIIGKLYVNSLLAALNSRKSLNGSVIQDSDLTTVDTSIGFHMASAISTADPNAISLRMRGSVDPERSLPYMHEEAAESELRFAQMPKPSKLEQQFMAL